MKRKNEQGKSEETAGKRMKKEKQMRKGRKAKHIFETRMKEKGAVS